MTEQQEHDNMMEAHIAGLEAELKAGDALHERMSKILSETANALHGGEMENGMWSWHDLAQLANGLQAQLAQVRADAQAHVQTWQDKANALQQERDALQTRVKELEANEFVDELIVARSSRARLVKLVRSKNELRKTLRNVKAIVNERDAAREDARVQREALQLVLKWKDETLEPMRQKAMDVSLAHEPCGYYCDESVGHVDHTLFNWAKYLYGDGVAPDIWEKVDAAIGTKYLKDGEQ